MDRIKQLEEEIAYLKRDPSAKFYAALVEAVEGVTVLIKSKKLDLESDVYAKSVIILAEKSDKIFNGLRKGLEMFNQSEQDEKPTKAKKSETRAI
jgi:hypothetical protein